MARRTTHIDVDNLRSGSFGDAGTFRHPPDFASRELNNMWAYSGGLAPQPGHRPSVDKIIAGRHLRNHEPGAKGRAQPPKGGIRDARHGCEKNPISELNTGYFQWLKA
jgi:hypothetical protein